MNDFKLDNENKISPGFTIPGDYFESLSEKVKGQLPLRQPKVIPLWDRSKKWAYAAVAVLVLSVSIPVADHYRTDANTQNTEVENYLSYHSTITDDDIIELLSNETGEISTDPESAAMEEILSGNAHLEEYIIN